MSGERTGSRIHKVISLNLRTAEALQDGPNHWNNRRDFACEWVRDQNPSIVGFQEATPVHLAALNSMLGMPGTGENRDPSEKFGEANPVYWDPELWRLEESRTFWLSTHPSLPVTKFHDSSLPRIFTVAVLESADERLRVINTHWDHLSSQARELSGILLRFFLLGRPFEDEAIENFAQRTKHDPTIVMGDFNEAPTDPGRRILKSGTLACGWEATGQSHPYPHTFHEFTGEDRGAIDGLYASPSITLHSLASPVVRKESGLWLSDHHPLVGQIEIRIDERADIPLHPVDPPELQASLPWPSDEERLREFLSR